MNLLNLIPGGPLIRALVVAAALAAAAAAITWQVKKYNEALREQGRDEVRLQVLADQTQAQADKRETDQLLRRNNERIDQTIQAHAQARAVADAAAADSLRSLDAALAQTKPGPANPTAPGGVDAARTADDDSDPRSRIIGECGTAIEEMGKRNRRLVDEKAGLQKYAREVCLAAGAAPPSTPPAPMATGPPGD